MSPTIQYVDIQWSDLLNIKWSEPNEQGYSTSTNVSKKTAKELYLMQNRLCPV